MAELPDLTVFANTINRKFGGKNLKNLKVEVDKKLNVGAAELENKLKGKKFNKVERVGKTLQFHFADQEILGLHLMLRGALREINDDEPLPNHIIVSFHFQGGAGFAVTDTLKQATLTLNPPENKVPDAFEISEVDFLSLLSKRSKRIKELLMDQKAIRGIGNSYADEILWAARISPLSSAKAIPDKAAKALYTAMVKVLKQAIQKITKENKDELRGELRDFMKIHGASIHKSPTGYPVKSEKINGRMAYFTTEQILYK